MCKLNNAEAISALAAGWISRVMETRGCTQALSAARTFHSRRDIQVKQAFIPPAACLWRWRWISAHPSPRPHYLCVLKGKLAGRSRFHQLGFIVWSQGFCHFKDKTIRDRSMNILCSVPRVRIPHKEIHDFEPDCETWVNKCAHSSTQQQFHILSWRALFG